MRLIDAKQVHRELDALSRQLERKRLDAAQPRGRLTDRARKRPRGDHVDVVQDHVERDEREASADARRAGRVMVLWTAEVRASPAGPDVGQPQSLAVPVEVD